MDDLLMGSLKLKTKILIYTVGLIAVMSVAFISLNLWMDYVSNLEHSLEHARHASSDEVSTSALFDHLTQGILFGSILGLSGCLLGLYVGKRLTRSLEKLSRVTEDLAAGRQPELTNGGPRDEFDELAESFSEVVRKRREAESSLEESRQHLLFILRENPLAYIEWDMSFRVMSWNKAAESIFGYTEEEARGRHALDLVVPDRLRLRITDVWLKILSGEGGNFSLNENVRKDRTRITCEWHNTVIRDAEGKAITVASLVNDVTQTVKTQEQMRLAMETAQKATRAKSEFLANMSHEIRTPLNGVIGLTELLMDSKLDWEQRSNLEIIHSSGEMLLAILNDILDLSKIESGKLELSERVFDLHDCLTSAFQLFSQQFQQKGLSNHIALDPELPVNVCGDPVRLRQIICNLVSNAIKFTDRGSITLEAWPEQISSRRVQINVSVSDTGQGIDPVQAESIFDPFKQADTSPTRAHGGTGLGLTICKRLCNLMRGEIFLEESSPNGTRFTFYIELQSRPGDAIQPVDGVPSTRLAVPDGKRPLNILLVEDNAVNQLVTKRLLRRLGHECVTVNNGHEALKVLAEDPCDIILMDLQMPVMDGFTATSQIRQIRGPEPYIVALTASAIEGDRRRCLESGMDDYLPKPIRIRTLGEVIQRFLENRKTTA